MRFAGIRWRCSTEKFNFRAKLPTQFSRKLYMSSSRKRYDDDNLFKLATLTLASTSITINEFFSLQSSQTEDLIISRFHLIVGLSLGKCVDIVSLSRLAALSRLEIINIVLFSFSIPFPPFLFTPNWSRYITVKQRDGVVEAFQERKIHQFSMLQREWHLRD